MESEQIVIIRDEMCVYVRRYSKPYPISIPT